MFDNLHLVNLTPHALNVVNEEVNLTVEPSGTIARVAVTTEEVEGKPGFFKQVFGQVEGLPAPEADTVYIVSAMVLSALGSSRTDVVAPATSMAARNEKGQIVSVPGFVLG